MLASIGSVSNDKIVSHIFILANPIYRGLAIGRRPILLTLLIVRRILCYFTKVRDIV